MPNDTVTTGADTKRPPTKWQRMREALPRGHALPEDVWERRHKALVAVLWLHIPFLIAVAIVGFEMPTGAAVERVLPVFAFALLASAMPRARARAMLCALGLVLCSVLLVNISGGLVEAHFHFFVVMSLLALYEDRLVYGLALAAIAAHHIGFGALMPEYVIFYHDGPVTDMNEAFKWTVISLTFIGSAAMANLILWRQNERSRLHAFRQAEARERTSTIARTLAQSLVPEDLPQIPSVQCQAYYQPGEGAVGGDWYDVLHLPEGRIGVALGDVAGHGVAAAALTARLRYTLRAYATEGCAPAQVMAQVERALDGATATCVYLVIDPRAGVLTVSCAGHLPPLVRAPDGSLRFVTEGRSVPLAGLDVEHVQGETAFPPGSTILLYSDGLVERRQETIEYGLERLRAAVQIMNRGDPDMICQDLPAFLRDDGMNLDDVALVVVRCLPEDEAEAVSGEDEGVRER